MTVPDAIIQPHPAHKPVAHKSSQTDRVVALGNERLMG